MATGGGSENVNIGIRMSNQDAVRAVDQLRGKMRQMEDRMKQSKRSAKGFGDNLEGGARRGSGAMDMLTAKVRVLAGALAGAFSIKTLVDYFNELDRRLEIIAQRSRQAQQGILNVAVATVGTGPAGQQVAQSLQGIAQSSPLTRPQVAGIYGRVMEQRDLSAAQGVGLTGAIAQDQVMALVDDKQRMDISRAAAQYMRLTGAGPDVALARGRAFIEGAGDVSGLDPRALGLLSQALGVDGQMSPQMADATFAFIGAAQHHGARAGQTLSSVMNAISDMPPDQARAVFQQIVTGQVGADALRDMGVTGVYASQFGAGSVIQRTAASMRQSISGRTPGAQAAMDEAFLGQFAPGLVSAGATAQEVENLSLDREAFADQQAAIKDLQEQRREAFWLQPSVNMRVQDKLDQIAHAIASDSEREAIRGRISRDATSSSMGGLIGNLMPLRNLERAAGSRVREAMGFSPPVVNINVSPDESANYDVEMSY